MVGMRVLHLVFAGFLLIPTGCGKPSTPNIIIYLIDTLRADHLGIYGYSRQTSPNIDHIATHGVVFDRAYTADTRTLGSIPSLMTSRHVPSHGVRRFGDTIPESVTTLAEVLALHGYDTASFVTNVNAGTMSRLDRGFRHFHDAIKIHRDSEALRSFPEAAFFEWLDRDREGPFFAYVHTAEPHRPYIPPPPFDTMFDPDYSGFVTGVFKGPNGYGRAQNAEDVAHVIALYDGEVRFADEAFGNLLLGLEARGLDDETIIVITADHGEELFDRSGWNHGQSLYDELLRIPLIITEEAHVQGGLRVSHPVQLVDIAPTILDILGLTAPSSFEGTSLLALMTGEHDVRISERPVFAMTTQPPVRSAIIKGQYKCVTHEDGSIELYDLVKDPGERTNLAQTETKVASALLSELRSWIDQHSDVDENRTESPLTTEEETRLRILGYVE